MNRVSLLATFAMLLIVALLIIWQVFGAALGITGQSTLNRT